MFRETYLTGVIVLLGVDIVVVFFFCSSASVSLFPIFRVYDE